MKTEKTQEKSKITYKIEVEKEEFDKYYEQTLANFAKEVNVKGFRKGFVPKDVAERNVDLSMVLSYTAEDCIKDKWVEIVNKDKLEAIDQPQIEVLKIAKGDSFEFKATVEVLPEIKLPNYKEIAKEVKSKEIKVSKKEYEDALNWLVQSRAKFSQKMDSAEKTDLIEITYHSPDLEGDKEKKDRFILGKGHYVEGLEEALIGLKKGDEKEVAVPNPKEKDKKITLKVKVESVQKMELPELNDEFATQVGFKDVKDLEKNINDGLKKEKEVSELHRKRTEVLDNISKKIKLDLPQALISREQESLVNNLKDRVKHELGIKFEDYLKQVNKKEEQIRIEFEKIAKERVKGFLILHAIEKQEKIKLAKEEIDKKIEELASQYPDKEKAKEEIKNSDARFYIEDELRRDKIFKILGC